MSRKLGATCPNFGNCINNDIFYYSTKVDVIQVKDFLSYEFQKFVDFPMYCLAKWAAEH